MAAFEAPFISEGQRAWSELPSPEETAIQLLGAGMGRAPGDTIAQVPCLFRCSEWEPDSHLH